MKLRSVLKSRRQIFGILFNENRIHYTFTKLKINYVCAISIMCCKSHIKLYYNVIDRLLREIINKYSYEKLSRNLFTQQKQT